MSLRRRQLAAFAAGLALAGLAALPFLFPAQAFALWCRLRYGGEPSAGGLVLRVSPAPPGTAGEGPGPWLLLELENLGGTPTTLTQPEPLGEEWSFRVRDPQGREITPRPLDPGRIGTSRPLQQLRVPARGRLGLVADLSRWVELPGPGRYLVQARRADLRDGHGLRSLPAWIEAR
ncbi:MAG TPA: hypothetical protein DEA08_20505 [Planctomycetes bacterium]|nr:hypothetical protein [Planctomycetota bacterium]